MNARRSLRWRIAWALAAITLLATGAIGVASYRTTRGRLIAEVDRSLEAAEGRLGRRFDLDRLPQRGPLDTLEVQVLDRDGAVVATTFESPFAPSFETTALAGQVGRERFDTVRDGDTELRVRTVGIQNGAIQVARSLDETNRVLQGLLRRTALLVLAVSAGAAAIGAWVAGRVTASLRRLTAAAEHVETTGRLDTQVGERGDDEVGRLGAAFDGMLAALARSRQQQQRLVQDAGHELRTPLTSLRTNVDTLQRYTHLSEADRTAILADLHAETEQLTELVNEIVAVASGDNADEPRQSFDLAELVRDVAGRYERRAGRPIVVVAEPGLVVAQRAGVQRAVSSLLDNACKFDTSGGPIEVSVGAGSVAVADRGIGIPAGEEALIFDRFHRAESARALPGSGLGLSIVREVAERHGGTASARPRDGGGAVVAFSLA